MEPGQNEFSNLCFVTVNADEYEYHPESGYYVSIPKQYPAKVTFHRNNINSAGYIESTEKASKSFFVKTRYFRPSLYQEPGHLVYLSQCIDWFPSSVQEMFENDPTFRGLRLRSKRGKIL